MSKPPLLSLEKFWSFGGGLDKGFYGSVKGKTSIFLYKENLNCEHYLENLSESVIKMKEINESDIIQLQFDNEKYHWTLEALQFYYENEVRLIDWPPYSPDLNPIENIWTVMKSKIRGRKFLTISSLKN